MDAVLDKIFEILGHVGAQATVLAIVFDFIFRLIPTKKPLGIIHIIIDMGAKIGAILIKLRDVSDTVLPQAVKETPTVMK